MPENVAKKKKKKKSIGSKIFGIIFLGVSIFLSVLAGKELMNIAELQNKAKEIETELELLKDENAELLATKEKLQDPDYVATYARGEYMFSKSDEKIFRLPSSEE